MSEQALVAVGGTGSRLRAGGMDVPITKSFLEISDRPLLHWSLQSLALGGVRRLVLTAEKDNALQAAESVVACLPVRFDEVQYHKNPGFGVHGLPYQTIDLLEDEYFFEAGHNLSLPSHYRNMRLAKLSGKIVLSAFKPHTSNERQPVHFNEQTVVIGPSTQDDRTWSLSHPFLLDKDYARCLPELDFSINSILRHHAQNQLIQWIYSDMPPEVDTPEEYYKSLPIYLNIIHSVLKLKH